VIDGRPLLTTVSLVGIVAVAAALAQGIDIPGSPAARTAIAAEGGAFIALGEGLRSCGEYVQATEAEKKLKPPTAQPDAVYSRDFQSFVDFADGYLSGANSKDIPQYGWLAEGTDHAGRMAWLENYCRSHPIDGFIKALIGLRQYLADQRH
jgi:hypothetical protein